MLSLLSNQAEHEARKKADGKRSRDDADAVKELLFKAFEKHQYYALKDLHALTKQPMVSVYITSFYFNWLSFYC